MVFTRVDRRTQQKVSAASFQLHPQLEADTFAVCTLRLCQCLLMNDTRFPWLILVPALDGLRELHDVPAPDRTALFDDIEQVSRALGALAEPFKINVAALGNQVPQLHIHVIARQQDDDAWPNPVWGSGAAVPYTADAAADLTAKLRASLI